MTPARPFAIAVVVACLSLGAQLPSAHAADPAPLTEAQKQAARELFRAAERDEDANRWADALEKFRRVGAVKLSAAVRYNIALCEEHLGQLVAALADYTLAESQAKSENAQDVAPLVAEKLKSFKSRVPRLTIVVPGDIVDAEVRLDGEVLVKEMWGVPVPLDPGDHKLEAKAPGRESIALTLKMEERGTTLYEVKLARVASAPPVARAPGATTTAAPDASSHATAATGATADTGASAPRGRGPAIIATVGAVVLAGGGVAAYLLGGTAHDDAQTQCAARHSGNCDDLRSGVRTWDALALGGWIGAAAIGAVAIVLWTRGGDAPNARTAAVARGQLVVGAGSVGVGGTF